MDYFPLIVTDQDKMIAQVIRRFVDQEIMPIRDKIDDDTDHVLINEILNKLNALGIFRAGT
ncbi:MAG: acyl-CoA dehydrogenase family protein, partial [Deltaproteobacteria bacterium]|nr:acyl-CoA dehydrogenase family protein [Deltaproteobacteria bacterium]MBW2142337.1 acyl-CoA dehydrogenase family protein [Deltaproteobacteria bacterium]